MDRSGLEREIRRLERSIKSRQTLISTFDESIKSAESGSEDLDNYKSKLDETLNGEKDKWTSALGKTGYERFKQKVTGDISRVYEGEKYYNMMSNISGMKTKLNNKVLAIEKNRSKEQSSLESEQEELKKYKEQLKKLEEQEHGEQY